MNKDSIQSLTRLFIVLAAGALAKHGVDVGGLNIEDVTAALMVIVSAIWGIWHHSQARATIASLKGETEMLKKQNGDTKV